MESIIHEKFDSAHIETDTAADTLVNQLPDVPGEYIQFSTPSTNTGTVLLFTDPLGTGILLSAGAIRDFVPVKNANVYYWSTTVIGDVLEIHALRH